MLAMLTLITVFATEAGSSAFIEAPAIVLTIEDVRVRSAQQSSQANLLAKELQVIRCSRNRDDATPDHCQPEAILSHLVLHQRGRDAASAMIVACQLVAIEQRLEQIEFASDRIDQWRQAVDKLIQSGQTKIDDSMLVQQEDRLPDAIALLRNGRSKLQLQLAAMLNMPLECAGRIVVRESLYVSAEALDPATAICDALRLRRDLRAIRQTCPCITEENLDTVRKLLGTFQPGLGLEITSPKTWLQRCKLQKDDSKEKEAALRRQQCCELAQSRERQIRREVVAAATNLDEAYERLAIAEAHSQTVKARISQRKKLSDLNLASGAQVIRGELESFAADDVVTQRRVAAREAEILWNAAQEKLIQREF